MNSEKHYRIKIWQEKDLCIEHVIKSRKAIELPGAETWREVENAAERCTVISQL